jgi:Polyketide cyclase / dehydrase and lipid transport
VIRYSSVQTIDRLPSVVFDILLDAARYSDWTEMQDGTWDGDGPVRVGTTGSFRMPGGPFAGTLRMEVVELAPDRRFVVRITHPKLDWIATTDLEADGSRTRMTYAGEVRLTGLQRLLEPFMRGEVGREEAREAERLKALLEGSSPVTESTATPA